MGAEALACAVIAAKETTLPNQQRHLRQLGQEEEGDWVLGLWRSGEGQRCK